MRELRIGDKGDDVEALQLAINQRARARGIPTVKVDRVFGHNTREAAEDVALALGVAERTVEKRPLTKGLQRIILKPGTRNPVQRARARARRKPKIITAGQLGLRFQYVFGLKGPVTKGAGHYTAGARAKNGTELAAEMRKDHAYHAGKGWGGVSYEALFADDGTIGLGNPTDRKSAAVAGMNTGLTNVCVPGTTGDRMTAKCRASIRWYLANAHTAAVPKAHRLPAPAAAFDWRGHREWPGQSTACPGVMLGEYKEIFA